MAEASAARASDAAGNAAAEGSIEYPEQVHHEERQVERVGQRVMPDELSVGGDARPVNRNESMLTFGAA